ncbi:MAG TPA: AAA family ATPase [Acidimicrobiales bacterium]|nr:AAA family ATPase [Acidimicrobiales bacterium]
MAAPDLNDEQAYIDRAYGQLERMRARAEELLASMKGVDPDLEWALLRRVQALADNPRALCFGRIDDEEGASWYVGRRHIEDAEAEPVVVEWRAPIALPFYRASWKDPTGLVRRRQFIVDGPALLSIGDDLFGADVAPPPSEELGVRGREALLVELERARSGEMLDIVATIQPEQDEIIRAPAAGILAVQGGPGSGKTAVGLHRAAFLLYGDEAMIRANILVVGPNRTFLRYIAQVLPSLGEHAVVQTTLADLVPQAPTIGPVEPPAVERLKGDGRMATLLARAVAMRRRADPADLEVTLGLRRLVISAAEVNALVAAVAERRLPYAAGREVLRDQLCAALTARYIDVAGIPPDGSQLGRELRQQPGLRDGLDRRWPSVSPPTLVAELLSNRRRLAEAASGVLSDDEQRLLIRRRGRAWASADAPLVDEAKDLIAGQSRTYGHVIADEAQDLSPMQLRMLARRCPSGSMTLLGDLAQGIGVWAHEDWRQLATWLPTAKGVRVVELRYGYRSPSQVLELASRLLPLAAPQVPATDAVRPGRTAPVRLVTQPDQLLTTVTAETSRLASGYATVAVIVPAPLVEPIVAGVAAAGVDVGEAERDGLSRPVTVVAAAAAKGLEFDAVVVVEPVSIAAELGSTGRGLRLLYVALTRPTQHLSIVSSSPLPKALAS